MAFWVGLIPPTLLNRFSDNAIDRPSVGADGIQQVDLGQGLITGGIIVIPVNPNQLWLMSQAGVAGTERVGKGELPENK